MTKFWKLFQYPAKRNYKNWVRAIYANNHQWFLQIFTNWFFCKYSPMISANIDKSISANNHRFISANIHQLISVIPTVGHVIIISVIDKKPAKQASDNWYGWHFVKSQNSWTTSIWSSLITIARASISTSLEITTSSAAWYNIGKIAVFEKKWILHFAKILACWDFYSISFFSIVLAIFRNSLLHCNSDINVE